MKNWETNARKDRPCAKNGQPKNKKSGSIGLAYQSGTNPKTPWWQTEDPFYWTKLLKDAGINWGEAPKHAGNKRVWKNLIAQRMNHLFFWKREPAKNYTIKEVKNRKTEPPPPLLICEVYDKKMQINGRS